MSLKKWITGSSQGDKNSVIQPNNNTNINSKSKPKPQLLSKPQDSQQTIPQLLTNSKLPFGNGDNKIFGMENFGNTCYCNSILQCLYYTKLFRENVLMFPESSKFPKTKIDGMNRHGFLVKYEQQQQILNGRGDKDKEKEKEKLEKEKEKEKEKAETPSRMKSVRRSSFFSKRTDDDSKNQQPQHTQAADAQQQPKHKTTTIVGTHVEGNMSTDYKKRMALINGPIINLDHSLSESYNMENTMFSSIKDIFESMVENSSNIGIVSPLNLVTTLKKENELFRSTMHQDAHEFLNFLMNNVIETIDNYNKPAIKGNGNGYGDTNENEDNWCNDIFQGSIINETKCLSCESITSKDEKFLDLSIDLNKNYSLTNCLNNFSKNEILTHENKFFCDYCNSLQEATKKMKLKKLPKILSLHLKRFKYNELLQKNIKLFNHISYPLYLRLFNTVDNIENPDKLYELYGVVVHIGGGPSHGHYVSLCKTEASGWLLFDDETVESIDECYVLKFFGDGPGLASAYVLFYQEIDESDYINKTLYNVLDLNVDDSIVNGEYNENNKSNSTINLRKQSDISTISNNSNLPNSISTNDDLNNIINENENEDGNVHEIEKSHENGDVFYSNNIHKDEETDENKDEFDSKLKVSINRNRSQSKASIPSSISNSNIDQGISNKSSFISLKRRDSKFWSNGKKINNSNNNENNSSNEKEKERENDDKRKSRFGFGFKKKD